MDNTKYQFCPYCKSSDIRNWFDEDPKEHQLVEDFDEEDD